MRNPMSYSRIIVTSRDESIILMKRLNSNAGLEKHAYILEEMGLKGRAYITERESVTAAIVGAYGHTSDCSIEWAESMYKELETPLAVMPWKAYSDQFKTNLESESGYTLKAMASGLSHRVPGTKGLKGTEFKVLASRYYGVTLADGKGRMSKAVASHLHDIRSIMVKTETLTAAESLKVITAMNGIPDGMAPDETLDYLNALRTFGIKRWTEKPLELASKLYRKVSRDLHPDTNKTTLEMGLSSDELRLVRSREAAALEKFSSAKKILSKLA